MSVAPPASRQYLPVLTCSPAPPPLPHCSTGSVLEGSNLEGTLPDTISAFTDLGIFSVHSNSKLGGTLPLSLSAWKKMVNFQVYACQFSGGPLPALPLPPTSHPAACELFNNKTAPVTNQFTCPWPAGALAGCTDNANGHGGQCGVPISNADCEFDVGDASYLLF